MIIQCYTMAEFIEVCFELMKKGATYKAHTHTLVVELTGGF